MDPVAARKVAVQALMDCLGYAAHEGTPMFSARLATEGPQVVFLGSISGEGLETYLDSAQAYLEERGIPPDGVSACREQALELMGILMSEPGDAPAL